MMGKRRKTAAVLPPEIGEPQRVAFRVAFRPDSSCIVRTSVEADDYESAVNLAAEKLGLDKEMVIEPEGGRGGL